MLNETLAIQSQLMYIDAAALTGIISGVTAVAVAIGATGIVLWRKFKKGVAKTLHIDENANKEVEEDIVINDEELIAETAATEQQLAAETAATEEVKFEKEAAAEEAPAEEVAPAPVEEAPAEESKAEEAPKTKKKSK